MTTTNKTEPTRHEVRYVDPAGQEHVEETASLSSVEIGESAKGDVSIKSVKVYHNSPAEAARIALWTYNDLKAAMEKKPVDYTDILGKAIEVAKKDGKL